MVIPGFTNNNIVIVDIAVRAVFCLYGYSIISYIKRANIKSYIAVIFGQFNINITGGYVAAAILTLRATYAVCSKRNIAAFNCGNAIIITVYAAG